MCVCVCARACVGSIFFFFVVKEHPFFCLQGVGSSQRDFFCLYPHAHTALFFLCVRERETDRHTDTETGSFSFWEKIYTLGVVRRQTPQNSDFVGTHTHTHTTSRYKKAVRVGVSFLSSALPLGGHLSPGIMYFRESLLEEEGIFHLQTDFL